MSNFFMKVANRRERSLAPIACAALVLLTLAGCATKSDVRVLRNDLASMAVRQDSLFNFSRAESQALADSVRATTELLRTVRGQLANQIRELQTMLVTVQELLGQSRQTIAQLREQMDRQGVPVATPLSPGAAQNAEELYRLGATKLQEKSATAARLAFEQFLALYPQHESAPDAQFGLAQAYVLADDLPEAIKQFERVAESYPASQRAPEALYRAGESSERLRKLTDARRYYNLVVQRYADSPTARLAQQALSRLRAR